jgi:hypothetical protein
MWFALGGDASLVVRVVMVRVVTVVEVGTLAVFTDVAKGALGDLNTRWCIK